MKKIILLLGVTIILSGCYTAKNTAKIRTGVNAAYIAPKGFNKVDTAPEAKNSKKPPIKTNLSSGAYFFDASMRMGVSNVIEMNDDQAEYQVRYLSEEQPDVAREFVRTLNASAEASVNEQDPEAIKAKATLINSLANSVQVLTDKSASLNLSRSILYRFNENVYNGASEDELELFGQAADSLIKLQEKELYTEIENLKRKKDVLNELNTLIAQMSDLGFQKERIDQVISSVIETAQDEQESFVVSKELTEAGEEVQVIEEPLLEDGEQGGNR